MKIAFFDAKNYDKPSFDAYGNEKGIEFKNSLKFLWNIDNLKRGIMECKMNFQKRTSTY